MRRAFLSYAHEDESIAKRLASDLRSRGLEVLSLDTVAMPGQGWAAQVSEAIEASDAFIVLVSRASETSQWVAQETAVAVSRAQDGGLRVIPVFVDKDVEPPNLETLSAIGAAQLRLISGGPRMLSYYR